MAIASAYDPSLAMAIVARQPPRTPTVAAQRPVIQPARQQLAGRQTKPLRAPNLASGVSSPSEDGFRSNLLASRVGTDVRLTVAPQLPCDVARRRELWRPRTHRRRLRAQTEILILIVNKQRTS